MLIHKIYFDLRVYIAWNVIQPLDITIENPVVREDTTKDKVFWNITDNDQNDCMAKSEEFPDENIKCVKEYSNIEGETETETRNSNHCRKLYSGRSCIIHCNCTWRKKKTQIHSKYCHCTNAVLVDLVTYLRKKSLMEDFIFLCSVFSVKIGSYTFVLYLLIWV